MHGNVGPGNVEQLGHLRLRQPHGFVFELYFQLRLPVRGPVKQNVVGEAHQKIVIETANKGAKNRKAQLIQPGLPN